MVEYLLTAFEIFYARACACVCVCATERETITAVPLIGAIQFGLYFIRTTVQNQ